MAQDLAHITYIVLVVWGRILFLQCYSPLLQSPLGFPYKLPISLPLYLSLKISQKNSFYFIVAVRPQGVTSPFKKSLVPGSGMTSSAGPGGPSGRWVGPTMRVDSLPEHEVRYTPFSS